MTAHVEHRTQIDIDDRVPIRTIHLVQHAVPVHPAIVDQHVNRPQFIFDTRDTCGASVKIGNIPLEHGDTGCLMACIRLVAAQIRGRDLKSSVLQRRCGSVIGITANVTDETLQRLQRLPAEGNYALLTEERNMFSFLNTIQNESSIDYRTIRRLSVESAPDLKSITPQLDALLYTLGGQETVDEQAVSPNLRCPINFEISQDSLHRLNSLFGQATVPGG